MTGHRSALICYGEVGGGERGENDTNLMLFFFLIVPSISSAPHSQDSVLQERPHEGEHGHWASGRHITGELWFVFSYNETLKNKD